MADQNVRKSSSALVLAAWVVVVVPAAWGLTHTVENALKIFNRSPAAVVTPAATPSPAPAPAR